MLWRRSSDGGLADCAAVLCLADGWNGGGVVAAGALDDSWWPFGPRYHYVGGVMDGAENRPIEREELGLRTFSWRLSERFLVCSVLRSVRGRWSYTSQRR